MEESTRWRSHLGERGWHARKIPTPVYRFFALVFLLMMVRGRTMGKLVSIVTTCLVVLSNKLQFWKNRLRRRTKRRSVMGRWTVAGSRFKTLRKSEIGYWKSTLWTLRRPAGWTAAGTTACHRLRKSQAESNFLTRFKGRFWTILSLIIDFVGLY